MIRTPIEWAARPAGSELSEWEQHAPPDVEAAGVVKFRIAGETDGSPYENRN
ncbi:hypothetical protein GCM10008961_24190 [Deinococcus knuensis]|uniref:Uncharacterized protein n=1 Tax=Deinococcus knuensis TaxID=1837380 RepID=A0ABQ2SLQ2_9DEIO|nr:hypothetical protein GCM10008961_24190 [Deinococcus knuensis]